MQSVTRRGKFISIELDAGYLTIHLGMTGKLLIQGSIREHTYGIFTLDEGVLLYHDPRQFGTIEWSEGVHPRVARLGPEPLEVSLEEFRQRLAQNENEVALAEPNVPSRSRQHLRRRKLFAAGIHPLASAEKLSEAEDRNYTPPSRQSWLTRSNQAARPSQTTVDAEGQKGWFQVEHRVYGREGEPCAHCGGPIRKILVTQRGTHYCPKCQSSARTTACRVDTRVDGYLELRGARGGPEGLDPGGPSGLRNGGFRPSSRRSETVADQPAHCAADPGAAPPSVPALRPDERANAAVSSSSAREHARAQSHPPSPRSLHRRDVMHTHAMRAMQNTRRYRRRRGKLRLIRRFFRQKMLPRRPTIIGSSSFASASRNAITSRSAPCACRTRDPDRSPTRSIKPVAIARCTAASNSCAMV